jgi:hypothetical protein
MFVQNVRLGYFPMLCNIDEYKMGQDLSRGQLCNVHNEVKNSGTPWLGLLFHYDTQNDGITIKLQ